MIDAQVGRRYATAIYDLAEAQEIVKELYGTINDIMVFYEKDKEFKNIIDHPLISAEAKKEFLTKVFGYTDGLNKTVVYYLVDKNRLSSIRSIVTEYLKIYYEKNNIVDVQATLALEPNEAQKEKLIKNIEKRTGKKVNLKVILDKSIIAGGIIKIGDEIIDGSVKKQLQKISEI